MLKIPAIMNQRGRAKGRQISVKIEKLFVFQKGKNHFAMLSIPTYWNL